MICAQVCVVVCWRYAEARAFEPFEDEALPEGKEPNELRIGLFQATGLAVNGLTSSLERSDAAVGAGDKDVRLAVQGAREKVVFQMDAVGNGDAGVAVGQTNARRKGRENRALSAGVWADASEADLLKKEKEVGVMVAKGGKKKKHAFSGRPDRPYSVVPVRDASGRPLSRQEQMAAVGGVRVAAAH